MLASDNNHIAEAFRRTGEIEGGYWLVRFLLCTA